VRNSKLIALMGGIPIATLTLAGAAIAADMAMPVYKTPHAASLTWAGMYVGVDAGYGRGSDPFHDGFVGTFGKLHPAGGFGGGQIGYNTYLTPKWVLGYEFDVSTGKLHDSGPSSTPSFSLDSKIDYFGTARTRLGYTAGPWLFYGTGGLAWTHNKFREVDPAIRYDADQFHVGWTVGGRAEYAFAPGWSVKAEYFYASFHENRDAFEAFPRTTDLTTSTVRVGLNYRLGGVDLGTAVLHPANAPLPTTAWSGSYIGLQVGYARGREHAFDGVFGQASSLNPSGGFGGSQIQLAYRADVCLRA
jgi:outer membrane immunogenic protein